MSALAPCFPVRTRPAWPALAALLSIVAAACGAPSDTGDAGADARPDASTHDGSPGMDTGTRSDSGGDGGSVTCGSTTCAAGQVCCNDPSSPNNGHCYDPSCLSCCMGGPPVDGSTSDTGTGTDTGTGGDGSPLGDTGVGRDGGAMDGSATCGSGALTCGPGQACCLDPSSPGFGHCYSTGCLACCMGGPPRDSGTTTCTTNADCPAADYCAGGAGTVGCSGPGTCVARPAVCSGIVSPVCGCDHRTYSNSCEAARAGVRVASPGMCPIASDGGTCSGPGQCDPSHPCSSGMRCCAPLPGMMGCGFCSPGICPG